MSRPSSNEFAPFYAGYIGMIPDDVSITAYLETALEEQVNFYRTLAEEKHDYAYAPGKWTIKQVLGHICDTERIFIYRALRISRGDQTPLAGFDQNEYVESARFESRSWRSLVEEYEYIRRATLSFSNSLQPDTRLRMGEASGVPVSVRALLYMTAGHEAHHIKILKERYL